MTSHDPTVPPPGLPVPVDDGAADHLPGQAIPALVLPSTSGEPIDLAATAAAGTLVLSCYPRTGRPGEDPPPGWDEIPGARCTPQACAFRDHHDELAGLGARMLGLSAQPLEEQLEAAARLGLPYPVFPPDRNAAEVAAWLRRHPA